MSQNSLLEKINSPDDLKLLSIPELKTLAAEIRSFIIEVLSQNGGHLASNLGAIEFSIALHYVFSSPSDKLIFDTSHQSYTHKILTGRKSCFSTLRKFKGVCGFAHPKESRHDPFFMGHAGTALSLALGLAKTRDAAKEETHIIPILGDGTLTCGLTFEALNNLPLETKNFIVVLNDNKMAISQNVGHIKNILSRFLNNPISNKFFLEIEELLSKVPACGEILARQGKKLTQSLRNLVSPAVFFEHLGLNYIGPIDGHDIEKMVNTLKGLKNFKTPVLLHLLTQKGKGLSSAQDNPTSYHGAAPFDPASGLFLPLKERYPHFCKIFGKHLLEMAEKDPSITVISPAMLAGSGLIPMKEKFPDRCLDVGIAEGHAVTYAGSLAHNSNFKVITSIYSTFLQRAFDNLFHDVCLQESPVLFTIDRAGLASGDGCTHHGIYDIGFLNSMPNMIVAQPRNGTILKELLNSAFSWKRPAALRYPNISVEENQDPQRIRVPGKGEIISQGKDLLIIGLGHMCYTALRVKERLCAEGLSATVVDPIFIKPLDAELFFELLTTHKYIVTIEEHALNSGFGMIFNSFLISNNFSDVSVLNFGIPDTFVQHGSYQDLINTLQLDADAIASKILNSFNFEKEAEYASSAFSK